MTVTAAEADFVLSARLLALTVTIVLAFTACPMKTPEDETVPAEADHATAAFGVPVTVAANRTVAPEGTVAELGQIDTAVVAVTVTVAEADFDGSAMLVAVTVKTVFEVTCGAVKRPEDEMLPSDADQFTAVSDVPVIVALNCCCAPAQSVGELGEMEITIVTGEEGDVVTKKLTPSHDDCHIAQENTIATTKARPLIGPLPAPLQTS